MRQSLPSTNLTDIGRLQAFTDGVLAIAITLLVLEIRRPGGPVGHLSEELLREWPSYLGYAVAFVYIGVVWLNHHYVFSQFASADPTLLWINFGIVGTASLIPFPTGVLAGAFATNNLNDQRGAVVLYALIAFFTSVAWIPLFLYLRHEPPTLRTSNGTDPVAIEIARPVAGAIAYVLAAGLGWFVQPIAAVVIFVLVVAYYAVTSTGLDARLHRDIAPEVVTSEATRSRNVD